MSKRRYNKDSDMAHVDVKFLFIIPLLAAGAGCSIESRHTILSFFFDGVPSLEQMKQGQDGTGGGEILDQGGTAAAEGSFSGSVHPHMNQCSNCHASREGLGFPGGVKLTLQAPELCYQCHERYANLSGWLHGPFAVSKCLICHNPHRSPNRHLLEKPQPELCYLCHNRELVETIDHHSEKSYENCTRCHDQHSGAMDGLLKNY